MPNDISMLRWADIPVAVANAHPNVLSSAHFTTSSNDEEGVAEFLMHVLDTTVGRHR